MRDLRTAVRQLLHRPAFCGAVVVTLGIALGAFTAIFSLVHALILRPLPFPDAGRLVVVDAVVGAEDGRLALREYRDLASDTRLFEHWSAYYRSQYNVTGGGTPESLTCTIGTSTMFKALGVQPILGDVWPEQQDFTRQYVVVLSYGVWQQRFGGRRDVVGSSIVMDGGSYQIMGVLPEGVDYPLQTDVFRAVTDYNAPHVRRYSAMARLRPGVTLAQAQSELDAFSPRFTQAYPDTNTGVRLRATRLRDAYVGRARPFLWLLLSATILLLVIACVNVTNLLLSRALAARGDFGVRLALGAGRHHLVRQSVVEALLLTALATGLGMLAARSVLQITTGMLQSDLPPWFHIGIDASVLAWATAVALATGMAVGLWPAIQASRTDLQSVLRDETSRTAGSRSQQTVRRVLIAGQALFAALLLVSASVFGDGLRGLMRIDTGFDRHNVLTFRVDPPYSRYPDISTTSELYRRASERLRAQPGVDAVGTNSFLPFSGLDVSSPRVTVEGRTNPGEEPFVNLQLVHGSYFEALRIPLQRGRLFEITDDQVSTPVAIVSARTARRFWANEDPLGRRMQIVWNQHGTGGGGGSTLWLTVVGVVGDVRFKGMDDTDSLDVYAPSSQLFAGDSYFVIRTPLPIETLRQQVRAAIDEVDRDQSYFDVQTLEARVNRAVWQHRAATAVLGVFGAIALSLAVIGIYAVTAHAVASERREIGIRLALGSSGAEVHWLIMRRRLVPAAVGIAVGMIGGVIASRVLARVIGSIQQPDVASAAALPLVLGVAATVACWLPVWRLLRHLDLTKMLRDPA